MTSWNVSRVLQVMVYIFGAAGDFCHHNIVWSTLRNHSSRGRYLLLRRNSPKRRTITFRTFRHEFSYDQKSRKILPCAFILAVATLLIGHQKFFALSTVPVGKFFYPDNSMGQIPTTKNTRVEFFMSIKLFITNLTMAYNFLW